MSDPAIVPQPEQFDDPFWDDPWADGQWPGSRRVIVQPAFAPRKWDTSRWDAAPAFSALSQSPSPTPVPTPTISRPATDKQKYASMQPADGGGYKGNSSQERGDFATYQAAINAVAVRVVGAPNVNSSTSQVDRDAANAIAQINGEAGIVQRQINSVTAPSV